MALSPTTLVLCFIAVRMYVVVVLLGRIERYPVKVELTCR